MHVHVLSGRLLLSQNCMCITCSRRSTTGPWTSSVQFMLILIISFCSLHHFRSEILLINKNVLSISCFPYMLHFRPSSILVSLDYVTRLFEYGNYISSDGMLIDEWWIAKDLQGNDHGLIEVLAGIFSGVTEENHEESQSGWQLYGPIFEADTSRMQV